MATFKEVTEERFDEMLEVLPPIALCGKGFLVGEPWRHSEEGYPMFAALVRKQYADITRYYESMQPMTVRDWRMLDPWRIEIVP